MGPSVPGKETRAVSAHIISVHFNREKEYKYRDDDLDFKMLTMVTMTQLRVPVWGRIENVTLKLISTSGTGDEAAAPSL